MKEFKKRNLGEYSKNMKDIFEIVTKEGSLENAINNCKKMDLNSENERPSKKNPCSKVYKLIENLIEYI